MTVIAFGRPKTPHACPEPEHVWPSGAVPPDEWCDILRLRAVSRCDECGRYSIGDPWTGWERVSRWTAKRMVRKIEAGK